MKHNTIWKYTLHPYQKPTMPVGAEILHVAAMDDKLCVWAGVDNNAEQVERDLLVLGTGMYTSTEGRKYLGTAVGVEGSMVFHVFDEEGSE